MVDLVISDVDLVSLKTLMYLDSLGELTSTRVLMK